MLFPGSTWQDSSLSGAPVGELSRRSGDRCGWTPWPSPPGAAPGSRRCSFLSSVSDFPELAPGPAASRRSTSPRCSLSVPFSPRSRSRSARPPFRPRLSLGPFPPCLSWATCSNADRRLRPQRSELPGEKAQGAAPWRARRGLLGRPAGEAWPALGCPRRPRPSPGGTSPRGTSRVRSPGLARAACAGSRRGPAALPGDRTLPARPGSRRAPRAPAPRGPLSVTRAGGWGRPHAGSEWRRGAW